MGYDPFRGHGLGTNRGLSCSPSEGTRRRVEKTVLNTSCLEGRVFRAEGTAWDRP